MPNRFWLPRIAIALVAGNAGVAAAQPYAYVGLNYEARVGILDLATNTIVGYLDAYANTFGIAFEPGTTNMYVCGGGHLTKYDLATRAEIADVSYGTSLGDVVAHPDGGFVYLGFGTDQCVRTIETATNTIVNTGAMPNNTVYIAISGDGSTVYAASANFGAGPRMVSLMNTSTYEVSSPIVLNGMPGSIAVSPDDTRLYLGYEYDNAFNPGNTISVFNTKSNSLITDITVPAGGVTDIAFNSDATKIYVAQPYIGAVTVIDAATLSVENSWSFSGLPWGVTVSPNDELLYVASFQNDVIYVVDSATGETTSTIPVGLGNGGPTRIRIAPGAIDVCVADFNNNKVVDSQDFFDFLGAFFDSDPSADVNDDGAVNSQDFFDFLNVFFQGCE